MEKIARRMRGCGGEGGKEEKPSPRRKVKRISSFCQHLRFSWWIPALEAE
jgi:hypothetical protein